MDMAINNLFKHKVHFKISSEECDTDEPYLDSKGRQYDSNHIENLESIGVCNANDLCLKCLEPFVVHIISTMVHEEREHIDKISVRAGFMSLVDGWDDDPFFDPEYDLLRYSLDNPKYCLHLFSLNSETSIYSFPEHLLEGPFVLFVHVYSYFIPPHMREEYINNWVESMRVERRIPIEENYYTPPNETFRQDRCVICLESTPNILYLECMHIVVCDSCDRMKRTERLRKNCDVCRSEISRRIKI